MREKEAEKENGQDHTFIFSIKGYMEDVFLRNRSIGILILIFFFFGNLVST